MLTSDIKFSVAMCVYENDNTSHFIQAIDSVINQTVIPSEIILVVDGPVSSLLQNVIMDYESKYSYLNTIWLKENMGHAVARQIAMENSSHDLVALMDSDDVSVPKRFEKQLKCFEENRNLSLVGGYILEINDNNEKAVGIRKVPLSDTEIKEYIKFRNPVNNVTSMFKKADVLKVGGYKSLHYCYEDYYLLARLYQAGFSFRNIPDVLVYARVGKSMYRRRGGCKLFISGVELQKFMLKNGIVNWFEFCVNTVLNFTIRILMPNWLRGAAYKTILRSSSIP